MVVVTMTSGHGVKPPKVCFAPQGRLSAHEFELAMESKPQKAPHHQSFDGKFECFAPQDCLYAHEFELANEVEQIAPCCHPYDGEFER
jgi:hypothetical protein